MEGVGAQGTPKRRINCYAYSCAFLASMTSVLLGYDIGVMSGAIIFIKKNLKITDVQVEIIAGILNVLSHWCIGGWEDVRLARTALHHRAFRMHFFVGALVMGLAPSYAWLMVGRFIAGIGVGYALMIAPVYTAELAPASSRGFLTSFPEVFINFGILLGYVSNYAFAKLPLRIGWRMMLGVGTVPSVLITVGVLAMPESPRWLVMQGRVSETLEEENVRLADIKAVAGILEERDVVVTVPKQHHGQGVWRELFLPSAPHVRRILVAAMGIHFFQQASGIDAVVLYSPRVFDKAGFSKSASLLATVAVGFTKTLFILVATFTLDRIGRRPLLLTSVAGMIVSLGGLGSGLTAISHHSSEGRLGWAVALAFASILAYVAIFSIGMGPITWVYTSEIFPLRLRAQGASVGVVINRVTSGVISMSFISLSKAISIGGAFFLYAGIATAGWVFFYTFLPETKGKTLEQTEMLFGWKEAVPHASGGAVAEVQMEERKECCIDTGYESVILKKTKVHIRHY